jgi:hypothetical protein
MLFKSRMAFALEDLAEERYAEGRRIGWWLGVVSGVLGSYLLSKMDAFGGWLCSS